ncbi:MAG TPA: hypothetical protein VM491_03380 [Burkholderiaceae bacterium]|jgi:hypothetical protein|nr:hypothetical protein [Burkholderiaceae bacterium]
MSELAESAVQWTAALGRAGGAAFVAVFVVATVLLFPTTLLTLAAGFAFGLRWTLVAVVPAATVGATVAFLVARHLLRDRVGRSIEARPRDPLEWALIAGGLLAKIAVVAIVARAARQALQRRGIGRRPAKIRA